MSRVGGAMLCVIGCVSAMASAGCAYFHPAFITNASPLRAAPAASNERYVLVCERRSITRSECGYVPQSEVNRLMAELAHR